MTSNLSRKKSLRYPPFVFTEHGVAMLSGILKSKRAVQVNIAIVRTFIKLREMLLNYADLRQKLLDMEKKYDKNFRVIFSTLQELLDNKIAKEVEARPIGFRAVAKRKKK